MVKSKFKLSQRTSGGAPDTNDHIVGKALFRTDSDSPQPPPRVSCHSPHFFSPHSLPLTCSIQSSVPSTALKWVLLRSRARSMSSYHSHHPHLLDSPVTYSTQMITPTRNAFSPCPCCPHILSCFLPFPTSWPFLGAWSLDPFSGFSTLPPTVTISSLMTYNTIYTATIHKYFSPSSFRGHLTSLVHFRIIYGFKDY